MVPWLPLGLPHHLAARAIERHGVVRGRGVEDAVIHGRRGLPRHLLREAVAAGLREIRGVLRSDLVERRVALAVIVVIHVGPVGAVVDGIVQLRLRRAGRVRGAACHRQSGNISQCQGFGSNVSLLCGDVRDPTLDLLDLRNTSIYVYSGLSRSQPRRPSGRMPHQLSKISPDGGLGEAEIGRAGGYLQYGIIAVGSARASENVGSRSRAE